MSVLFTAEWTVLFVVLPALHAVVSASGWNYTVRDGVGYDTQLRAAISHCFTHNTLDTRNDDIASVMGNDVRLTPSDWWPPRPLTINMIRVMVTVCRSQKLRASTNHCIDDIYMSAQGNDLHVNMALAQLPVQEAWEKAQDRICISSGLFQDLPCVAHLQFVLRNCVAAYLNRSLSEAGRRFLVCRQVDASEECQRSVYQSCSRHTSQTLATVTRILIPALCPPRATTSTATSGHVITMTVSLLTLVVTINTGRTLLL